MMPRKFVPLREPSDLNRCSLICHSPLILRLQFSAIALTCSIHGVRELIPCHPEPRRGIAPQPGWLNQDDDEDEEEAV